MSTYLIDFENVKSGGLVGIDHIKKEDSVHLFWSVRESKISIEMMELIRSSESEIVMHKAVTGERDALDHQLCSYLGFLAGGKGETDFIIVSNDKAYDHLIEFWKKMNDEIRIRRVSEISKVSDLPSDNIVQDTSLLSAESAAEDSASASSAVSAVSGVSAAIPAVPDENMNGRNSRRRERGGKYLRGGKAGRGIRKNSFAEERQEEEKTVDRVKESVQYEVENSVKERIPAKTQERRRDSAAALVVTGIKTGVLVQSGFTADGILDNRNYQTEEKKEPEKESEILNENPEPEKETEIQSEEPEPEKEAEIQSEEPEPEKETEIRSEEPEPEKETEIRSEEPEPDKEAEVRYEESESIKTEEVLEAASGSDKETEILLEEPDQEKDESIRKTKTRAARTQGRAKRGRPPKKEHADRLPEIKIMINEADVIAKCEEAAHAEWTGEVVRLINHSKDKKELYSAIVKLLGQEKGRTVYHAIKILK